METFFQVFDMNHTPAQMMEIGIDKLREADTAYYRKKWKLFLDKVWQNYSSLLITRYYHRNSRSFVEQYGRIVEEKPEELTLNTLPVINMPCAAITEQGMRGLYFVAMMAHNPDDTNFYLVKVGKAEDIGNRMKQYASHNPMIYHNNCSLYISEGNLDPYEHNCHIFLSNIAFGRAQNSLEWYYVNEKDYYALCDLFSSPSTFAAIACGKVSR